MVRPNIITPEVVWEERNTRVDSWLHSAGWLIRVIKRTRRRRRQHRAQRNKIQEQEIKRDVKRQQGDSAPSLQGT